MYRALYRRATKHGSKHTGRKSPLNLNTMPQRCPRIVSNLLSAPRVASYGTRATRVESSASPCSRGNGRVEKCARSCVQTNNGPAGRELAKIFIVGYACFGPSTCASPSRRSLISAPYSREIIPVESGAHSLRCSNATLKSLHHRSYLIETQHLAGYPTINLVSLSVRYFRGRLAPKG